MYVISTKFIHKKEHKNTWSIPGKNKGNQIDHILIKRKRERMIDDVRSYRGTSVETDHNLVITKMKLRMVEEKHRQVKKKCDKEKLEKEKEKKTYENEINNLLQKENKKESLEEEWNTIKTIIIKSSEKIIGTKRVKSRNGCFDEECEKIS
ncbi:hypothetical protein RN001_013799 [Aquatica leii]|uniref:Uncharacterized protein n=1 Tax=Aquatica leii TaxID=1421715 RepID=A0AAN7SE48_9COLE|nr:hypothetical protein RN001_013799 [Aquatica leii]